MKTSLMTPILLTAGLSLLASLPALAGTDISGGGNALVCFDTPSIPLEIRARDKAGKIIDGSIRNEHISHITRIEVLDLLEAQFQRGLKSPESRQVILPQPNEEYEDYARRLFSRLLPAAPKLAQSLLEQIEKMPASQAVGQPDGLYPVDDYNLLGRIDSTNCVVGTIALHQMTNVFSQGSWTPLFSLHYDARLMEHPKHSRLSRYALYVHELVYSFLRGSRQEPDSRPTRDIVGALLRRDIRYPELKRILTTTGVLDYSSRSNRFDRLGFLIDEFQSKLSELTAPELEKKMKEFGVSHDQETLLCNLANSLRLRNVQLATLEITQALPGILEQLELHPADQRSMLPGKFGSYYCDKTAAMEAIFRKLIQRVESTAQMSWPFRENAAKAKLFLAKYGPDYPAQATEKTLKELTAILLRNFDSLYTSGWADTFHAQASLPAEKREEFARLFRSREEERLRYVFEHENYFESALGGIRLSPEVNEMAPDLINTAGPVN